MNKTEEALTAAQAKEIVAGITTTTAPTAVPGIIMAATGAKTEAAATALITTTGGTEIITNALKEAKV